MRLYIGLGAGRKPPLWRWGICSHRSWERIKIDEPSRVSESGRTPTNQGLTPNGGLGPRNALCSADQPGNQFRRLGRTLADLRRLILTPRSQNAVRPNFRVSRPTVRLRGSKQLLSSPAQEPDIYPDNIDKCNFIRVYLGHAPTPLSTGLYRVATGTANDLVELLKDKPQGEVIVFDD